VSVSPFCSLPGLSDHADLAASLGSGRGWEIGRSTVGANSQTGSIGISEILTHGRPADMPKSTKMTQRVMGWLVLARS